VSGAKVACGWTWDAVRIDDGSSNEVTINLDAASRPTATVTIFADFAGPDSPTASRTVTTDGDGQASARFSVSEDKRDWTITVSASFATGDCDGDGGVGRAVGAAGGAVVDGDVGTVVAGGTAEVVVAGMAAATALGTLGRVTDATAPIALKLRAASNKAREQRGTWSYRLGKGQLQPKAEGAKVESIPLK
jgi:hypothetical protein